METPTAQSLLTLGRSFTESRILLSAAELDFFSIVEHRAQTAEEVCAHIGGDLRAIRILLDASAAMGLLTKTDGRYACPPEIARFLAADSPESILPMLRHSGGMWSRWSRLTEIAEGEAGRARSDEERQAAQQRAFIGAMHVVGRPLADAATEMIRPWESRRMIDIGGGSGTYTIACIRRAPELTGTLFDLPQVVEMARERLAAEGLLERVTLVAGSFEVDELPGGHDLALLSAIIHQNSPEENLALYAKAYRALEPGGRLIVRDHILSPDRLSPRAGALFAVNMLAGTPGGDCYTWEEIESGLREAGFAEVRLLREDTTMDGFVEAVRA